MNQGDTQSPPSHMRTQILEPRVRRGEPSVRTWARELLPDPEGPRGSVPASTAKARPVDRVGLWSQGTAGEEDGPPFTVPWREASLSWAELDTVTSPLSEEMLATVWAAHRHGSLAEGEAVAGPSPNQGHSRAPRSQGHTKSQEHGAVPRVSMSPKPRQEST